MAKDKRVLTPTEAAKMLMVSPVTLRQWAQKDKLKSHTTLGGHRRFLLDEVIAFARKENITLMEEEDNSANKKVLIVDDDKSFAYLLHDMLVTKFAEWSFEYAHDGFDAGLKVNDFRPDVMLIDLKLPGVNGNEVCRNIKAKTDFSALRIIGMTGFIDAESVQSFLDAGAEDVLEKPIDTDRLFELLAD